MKIDAQTPCRCVLSPCREWLFEKPRARASGPFVITPSHVSYLDPMAIAAALPYRGFRRLYWAADGHLFFFCPHARFLARALHMFPVDQNNPAAALAASRVLRSGEGCRSGSSKVGALRMGRCSVSWRGLGNCSCTSVPVLPAYIRGAFEALPRTRRVPHPRPISVAFGQPVQPDALRADGCGQSDEERITIALHRRGAALGNALAARP